MAVESAPTAATLMFEIIAAGSDSVGALLQSLAVSLSGAVGVEAGGFRPSGEQAQSRHWFSAPRYCLRDGRRREV
jgi:hypothetical protein